MSTLIANADGNLTGASTFAAAEAGANALTLIRNSTTTFAAAASSTSSSFTVTNAKVIDAVLLWLFVSAASPTGTFKVDLQKGGVSQASVTVNKADLPDSTNAIPVPVLFKLSSTATGDGGSNWTIVVTTTGTGTVTYNRATSTSANFTRALRTTTAATAAAGDDLYILGGLTGAGTHNSRVVTVDSAATTAYGNGSVNSTTVSGGLVAVANYGTLTYGTSASTNYVLRVNGDLCVYQFGTLNIGASGAEIPRNSTAVLEFQPVSADGDFGLQCLDNSVVNIAGLSRTSGKNVVKCNLNSDLAASGTSLGVDTDTGWLSGDVVCVASTTRTASQCEALTLGTNAASSSMTVGAATNAHSGTSPTQAEVGLLTRNVKIRSTSSTLMAYVYATATAALTASWAEFYYVGATSIKKRGIEIDATSSGTAGVKSITYCSVHDCDTSGVYLNGGNSLNLTFSNNVLWNSKSSSFVNLVSTITLSDWTFDNNLLMLATSNGFSLNSMAGVFTNNTAVGAVSFAGFNIASGSTIGTFSGNTVHSCTTYGCLINTGGLIGTINSLKAYRNSNCGVFLSSAAPTSDLVFNDLVLFGNKTGAFSANIGLSGCDVINITGNSVLAGDTTFSTSYGIYNSSTVNLLQLNLSNVDMSGVGGIYVPHDTSELSLAPSSLNPIEGQLLNCKFGAPALLAGKTNWSKNSYLGIQCYNQTNGDHRTEMTYGQLKTDSTIYRTAAPSMRLTPNNASNKLTSAPKNRGLLIPVANGNAASVSVYVRKSASGDGAPYNGNQPRLIQRANPALGQNSDVVLATSTSDAYTSSDSNFSSVTLLAGFDGANNATSFSDESAAAHGAATFGGASVLSTAQKKFGTASLYAPNNCITWPDSTDFSFGSGAFTVECWFYTSSVGGTQFLVAKWGASVLSWVLYLSGGKLAWNTSTTGSNNNADIVGATSVTSNTFHHACVDFDGSKYRMYLDGVMDGSFSTPRALYTTPGTVPLSIGANSGGSFPLNGYFDECRITKGVGRYINDAGLTVPTAAFPRANSTGFEALSASTSVPTDDGAWELVVDCDGTTGWVNVADWSVS